MWPNEKYKLIWNIGSDMRKAWGFAVAEKYFSANECLGSALKDIAELQLLLAHEKERLDKITGKK